MSELVDISEVTVLGLTLADFTGRVVILAVAVAVAAVLQHILVPLLRRTLEASEIPSATIFINLLRVLIWSFALLSVLQPVFGVDPTWLVTTLGVISVAISLGLQDTVSNVIGGLSLMAGKVVKPGDWIEVGSIMGQVTDVNWRSTTVRARNGNVSVIPNSVLNNTTLTRYVPWEATVQEVAFEVVPEADLDEVEAEVLALAHEAAGDLMDPDIVPDVVFWDRSAYGTQGHLRAHIKDGVAVGVFKDRLSRALQGRPWLASALNEPACDK